MSLEIGMAGRNRGGVASRNETRTKRINARGQVYTTTVIAAVPLSRTFSRYLNCLLNRRIKSIKRVTTGCNFLHNESAKGKVA